MILWKLGSLSPWDNPEFIPFVFYFSVEIEKDV